MSLHARRSVNLVLVGLIVFVVSAGAAEKTIKIKVTNDSKVVIRDLHVSPAEADGWGPDQLGDAEEDVLAPGDSYILDEVPCGTYDVALVLADGRTCEEFEVDLCARSETWTVDDETVAACKEPEG